jgi:hypothetical protein
MSRSRIPALLLPVVGLLLLPVLLPAAQPEPAKKNQDKGTLSATALAQRIDQHIMERWKKEGIKPSGPADDATFFRRVYLDLAGKIPPILDIGDFLDDDRPDKRQIWVDMILGLDKNEKRCGDGEFVADHFATVYRRMILGNIENEQVIFLIGGFENWLRKKFKENTPYNKMVHELLTSNPQGGNQFGGGGPGDFNNASPAAFFAANENKAENLAGATARLFLGVKIECAECHKHPFAEWSRTQFWEFAAFFANANFGAVPTPDNGGKPAIEPQPKANEGPQIMIPKTDPAQYVKAKFLDGRVPQWQGGMEPRKVLADWVVAPENPYFARMTVNYLWTYFFGIGLVDPVDDLGKHNPASHPELLDELADQFVKNGYDLKYLMKAMVNSKIYQLSSAPLPNKPKVEDENDLHRLFARMQLRQLSGDQLFDSLAEVMEYKVDKTRTTVPGLGLSPRDEFLAKFNNPENKRIDTHTSILQALHLMNGKFLANATSIEKEKNPTLWTIVNSSADTTKRLQTVYLVTLARMPRPEEMDRLSKYIDSGGANGDRNQALGDVFWALLNCAEFSINH